MKKKMIIILISTVLVALIVILLPQIRGQKSDDASSTDASSTDGVSETYEIESTKETYEQEVVVPYSDDIFSGYHDIKEIQTELETTEQKKEEMTAENSTTATEEKDSEQESVVTTTENLNPDRYELPVVPAE